MKKISCFLKMSTLIAISLMVMSGCAGKEPVDPIRVVTGFDVGETREIILTNGERVKLTLLDIDESRDSVRNAIREVMVRVSVDGEKVELRSGNYNLPVSSEKVKMDCPVTKGYLSTSIRDLWKIKKDARIRVWPADSPYFEAGAFGYPVKQRWMASMTHSGNEPSLTGWGVRFDWKNTYYHEGHDIGGADGMDTIVSATDGKIISVRNQTLPGYEDIPTGPREDKLFILDKYHWLYHYSHFDSIFMSLEPGDIVKKGQPLGIMGKKGGSGGIAHLHFGIYCKDNEKNKWMVEDAYPYLWEAYKNDYKPKVMAVARPLQILFAGQQARLNGSKSRCIENPVASYEWYFNDGSSASGPIQYKRYKEAGAYSEVLKVTDSKGNMDYDFATVYVYPREHPEKMKLGAMQLAYYPTLNLKAGDDIAFLVRTFHSKPVKTIWDFGDGSNAVETITKGITKKNHAKGAFQTLKHTYAKPGNYLVTVKCSKESGLNSVNHLDVLIE